MPARPRVPPAADAALSSAPSSSSSSSSPPPGGVARDARTPDDLARLGALAARHAAELGDAAGGAGRRHGQHHPNCILLSGQPGAGKTVFARGFIRALAHSDDTREVPSPTFCLDFDYPLDAAKTTPALSRAFPRGLHHLDLYRMAGATQADAEALELPELCQQSIMLVEWPDRLAGAGVALDGALCVHIEVAPPDDDNSSQCTLGDELSEEMLEAWVSRPRRVTFSTLTRGDAGQAPFWDPWLQANGRHQIPC